MASQAIPAFMRQEVLRAGNKVSSGRNKWLKVSVAFMRNNQMKQNVKKVG